MEERSPRLFDRSSMFFYIQMGHSNLVSTKDASVAAFHQIFIY
ncbi:hypothetical protein QPK24_22345 [Paenibacillus polygoni]|uniref:Uncharacterized protein n=1 Tax=Paenibacillus polygoni TaxID=3050112 RepID=A0ABY8X0W1_9BACL|nr:hypothetical protein [Paenibacillus polygoni]WIV19025.1 hypothetical protein QPK24_22345 [Paenibacillus polygoni]